MDNFFKDCPAVMSDGRAFTDYRTSSRREQYNKMINGIVREDDYRMFLQQNANTIMDNVWSIEKGKANKCQSKTCIHKEPSRTTSGANAEELKVYNAVKLGQMDPQAPRVACSQSSDYRMSVTPKTTF